MLQTTFRPIQMWPRERTRRHVRASFRSSYSSTIELLAKELGHLGAREAVLQLDLDEGEIIRDGSRPYANAAPRTPAVMVAFESKHGPIQMACDRFDRWHANLRAIALGLESLRRVDRYGITQRGEQYTGWRQLPENTGAHMPTNRDQATSVLSRLGGISLDAANLDLESAQRAYRSAAMRTHPDRGGDLNDFQRVAEAARLLGLR